jgi:nucleotide-binding universal stress UspA family protein
MTSKNPVDAEVVVVGVDGSEASKDALRWAIRYARMAGATVHAVTAWQHPASFGWAPSPAILEIDLEDAARQALKETIQQVVGAQEPVTVQTKVVEGPPALMLLKASEGADLLVVGSSGHGAFAGMLLGSVSEHCVHHAACPVVVTRYASDRPGRRPA